MIMDNSQIVWIGIITLIWILFIYDDNNNDNNRMMLR